MSDGNKPDLNVFSQARPTIPLSLDEMGNILLDAMQGTLICLDKNQTIVDVSKTIKTFFGFEQSEIIGLSVLMLIEDSERESFSKFLRNFSSTSNFCSARMMTATSNEFRNVKVHQKRKNNVESVDVHSTTTKPNSSIDTILVLTLDDCSYIDISLFDIHKQEFYTKINLTGEILFEDHRAAPITGFLPNELVSNSIFNFVHKEDRLVKLHALWKCVTTGTSKSQWRFNARNGSLVYLHTEYKLISDKSNGETIVARNEILSSSQQAQFDDLQAAWRHQCTADIRGNGATFKIISSNDVETSSRNECRISVPSLNMFFATNKLQPISISGNVFQGSKLVRPLTIQDYIQILIDHDPNLDGELIQIIQSIETLAARQKNLPISTKNFPRTDSTVNEHFPTEPKKTESESIIRGMLANSVKPIVERPTVLTNSVFSSPQNFTENQNEIPRNLTTINNQNGTLFPNETLRMTTIPPIQNKPNSSPLTIESIHQQHNDFMKKYKAAKIKLESQLESARNQEMFNGGQQSDVIKRNTIINKLSQLENIKNKHLSRILDLKRQALNNQTVNNEEKDLLTSSLNCPTKKTSIEPNGLNQNSSIVYNSSTSFYPQQQRIPNSMFDDYFGSTCSNNNLMTMNNNSLPAHSYMNLSFRENSIMTSFNTNSSTNHNFHQSNRPSFPF